MADNYEVGDIADSGNVFRNSGNIYNTDASATLTASATESFNSDSSTNGSFNNTLGVADSFNETHTVNSSDDDVTETTNTNSSTNNSGNQDNDTTWTDSNNQWTDSSVNDSNNEFSWSYTDDHSVNVGNRSYGGGEGGAAGVGGTVVDQSVNGAIAGDGYILGSSSAVVASGENSIAAGNDVSFAYDIDESTNIYGGGDVNVGNETTITTDISTSETHNYTDETVDSSVTNTWVNSYNTDSNDVTFENSFTNDQSYMSEDSYTVDVNAIVDSNGSAILDDSDLAL